EKTTIRYLKTRKRLARKNPLFEKYRDKVQDGPTDRTLRRYMKKMEAYGLIESSGSTRDRVYRLKN
ncbi:hypothetical protein HRED_09637, partial [Candidatus Haloredivivus sp. G17]